MKDVYIVANWKANKKETEAEKWFEEFSNNFASLSTENKKIIICPSFILLSCCKRIIQGTIPEISLGSQDISYFPEGAYTGEVPYIALSDMVDYCIIGHSERRKNFHENDDMLQQKVANAISGSVTPIYCVQSADTFIPRDISIVAYEPIEAIGTGNPDTPENAEAVASKIKSENENVSVVLYGGSVNSENIKSFTEKENIDGVLVGGASLDPNSFISIIKNVKEN